MRKFFLAVSCVLLLSAVCFAEEPFYLPDYFAQSNYLSTTPGVAGDASGAFFNPAVWAMLKGPEVQIFWNDLDRKPLETKNWTLLTGVKGLGFGMQQWTYGELQPGGDFKERSLYDYNIALACGDAENSFGLGYSWSKGYVSEDFLRDNTLSMGFLSRPMRYLSVGMAGHYALREENLRGIVDVGVRPLGTPFLTIFGDAYMNDYQTVEEVEWAAGLAVQPLPGISLIGKFFHGGVYTVGISFSPGGSQVSATPRYDNNGKLNYTTYGIKLRMPPYPGMLTDVVAKDKFYLKMKLQGRLKYQRYKLFDDDGHTLTEVLEALENAKKDPKVAGVAINLTEDFYGSWELIWEVREKMKEVQAEGKKVVVYLERGDQRLYYLASAADEIMVDPNCLVMMQGFNLGRTYYRNMLNKMGLGIDAWQFFKYKTAAEGFSRTDMSEGDREQIGALIEGWYGTMRADICASRGISEGDFDHIVNEVPLLTADSLLTFNLADTVGVWDEMEDWIKVLEGGKKKRMQGAGVLAKAQPVGDEWGKPPEIAVIYALGVCDMNSGINARKLRKVIKKAREDDDIKAVVFRADSPGGDILPSDIVAEELKKTAEEKPVIVSQGWVAGSGGYWISMYGDKIVASPWTITGSIGVIGLWLYNDGLGDKLGLTYDNVQIGKHADLGRGISLPLIGAVIPERNVTEEERAYIETMIKKWYQDFLNKVAEGRNMTVDEVHEVAQGRIWTGTDGKEIGLVDELGGLETAIKLARQAAGIEPDKEVKIVEMPEKGWLNPNMFQPKLFGMEEPVFDINLDDPELMYLRMILNSKGQPMLLMPPEYYLE